VLTPNKDAAVGSCGQILIASRGVYLVRASLHRCRAR